MMICNEIVLIDIGLLSKVAYLCDKIKVVDINIFGD